MKRFTRHQPAVVVLAVVVVLLAVVVLAVVVLAVVVVVMVVTRRQSHLCLDLNGSVYIRWCTTCASPLRW
jgi:hypothetical protein